MLQDLQYLSASTLAGSTLCHDLHCHGNSSVTYRMTLVLISFVAYWNVMLLFKT